MSTPLLSTDVVDLSILPANDHCATAIPLTILLFIKHSTNALTKDTSHDGTKFPTSSNMKVSPANSNSSSSSFPVDMLSNKSASRANAARTIGLNRVMASVISASKSSVSSTSSSITPSLASNPSSPHAFFVSLIVLSLSRRTGWNNARMTNLALHHTLLWYINFSTFADAPVS